MTASVIRGVGEILRFKVVLISHYIMQIRIFGSNPYIAEDRVKKYVTNAI